MRLAEGSTIEMVPDDDLAWGDGVKSLQEEYTISFTVEMTPPLVALLFDGPQRLWWEMSQLYRPFWWRGEP